MGRMAQRRLGPNATLVAHAAVGMAGSAALHALVKPKTEGEKILVWLAGAVLLIWLHQKFDLPAARMVAAAFPALG